MKMNSTDNRLSTATILDSLLSIAILVFALELLRYAPAYSRAGLLPGMLGIYGIIVVALVTSIIVNFYSEVKNEDDEAETEGGNNHAASV